MSAPRPPRLTTACAARNRPAIARAKRFLRYDDSLLLQCSPKGQNLWHSPSVILGLGSAGFIGGRRKMAAPLNPGMQRRLAASCCHGTCSLQSLGPCCFLASFADPCTCFFRIRHSGLCAASAAVEPHLFCRYKMLWLDHAAQQVICVPLHARQRNITCSRAAFTIRQFWNLLHGHVNGTRSGIDLLWRRFKCFDCHGDMHLLNISDSIPFMSWTLQQRGQSTRSWSPSVQPALLERSKCMLAASYRHRFHSASASRRYAFSALLSVRSAIMTCALTSAHFCSARKAQAAFMCSSGDISIAPTWRADRWCQEELDRMLCIYHRDIF